MWGRQHFLPLGVRELSAEESCALPLCNTEGAAFLMFSAPSFVQVVRMVSSKNTGKTRNYPQYLPARGYCFLTVLIDWYLITHSELVIRREQLVCGQGGVGTASGRKRCSR